MEPTIEEQLFSKLKEHAVESLNRYRAVLIAKGLSDAEIDKAITRYRLESDRIIYNKQGFE
jgi:hypothetical protein